MKQDGFDPPVFYLTAQALNKKTPIMAGKIEKEFDSKKYVLATKEDLAREIGNSKSEVIKWMFIFWVGQLAAMIAIAKLFFH